jgi:hypothetical protein
VEAEPPSLSSAIMMMPLRSASLTEEYVFIIVARYLLMVVAALTLLYTHLSTSCLCEARQLHLQKLRSRRQRKAQLSLLNDPSFSNTVCSPYCKFQFPTSKITHMTQPTQINHGIRHQPHPPSIMAGCHHSQPFNNGSHSHSFNHGDKNSLGATCRCWMSS